ncbi:hypothetical protein R1sor_019548 [Riccia sorocarpa]|uniref:Peroxidase n=1 Tax=Riccia sorocarpa TaxID=122646 RepID=A0ABD3IDG2_9MARC
MASGKSFLGVLVLMLALSVKFSETQAQLSATYYDKTCPNLRNMVAQAFLFQMNLIRIITAPASLLRVAFHDCAVDGCQGSIMLNSQGAITDEKLSERNLGIQNLDVIDAIKAQVERSCPGVVSCADLIILIAHEAIKYSAGPNLPVVFGRKDARFASKSAADSQLLPADATVDQVLSSFAKMGIDTAGSVALLGSHTIGVAHCKNVVNRLYPAPDATLSRANNIFLLNRLRAQCPVNFNPNVFINNDGTNTIFDSGYYQAALQGRGVLTIDDRLANDPRTKPFMQTWAFNTFAFRQAFQGAWLKMTSYRVLTGNGTDREVRRNCRFIN